MFFLESTDGPLTNGFEKDSLLCLNGVGEVFAVVGEFALLGHANLGLIVEGNLVLEDLESLHDVLLDSLLSTGKDPDVLGLSEKEGVARVDNSEIIVIGVKDSVVTSGGIGEELDLALSTVEGGNSSSVGDLVELGVVLGVQHTDGTVGVDVVASLLAVVGFPGHAAVSGCLMPQAHVGWGYEVLLEGGSGA